MQDACDRRSSGASPAHFQPHHVSSQTHPPFPLSRSRAHWSILLPSQLRSEGLFNLLRDLQDVSNGRERQAHPSGSSTALRPARESRPHRCDRHRKRPARWANQTLQLDAWRFRDATVHGGRLFSTYCIFSSFLLTSSRFFPWEVHVVRAQSASLRHVYFISDFKGKHVTRA